MLLFLSHAGSDKAAAATLKERLLSAPAAQAAGLNIWFDQDELQPGDAWQPALEDALMRADAFLVYVGGNGVVNWVDREVRTGLDRATGPDAIPFFPVLASADVGETILPPFARQHQTCVDPLGDDAAFADLLAAILGRKRGEVALIDTPFVGLRAMDEAEADHFFGRDTEVATLTDMLMQQDVVAVVADSGAGKSSLVRAGLVPAFRGGALVPQRALQDPAPRHVVIMRPRGDPLQGLRDGVDRAARNLGRDASVRRSLRQSIRFDDPQETFYALACDIDHDAPDILLVIDQCEELLTATPPDKAATFVDFLMALLDQTDRSLRVVLTIRADYFNLMRPHTALFDRLTRNDNAAQLRLKRISDTGLEDVVKRPLVMAGHQDAAERDALSAAIKRDMTGRPGDLALVQMALYATWRRAQTQNVDLMTAYTQVHGVLGALAHQAEEVQTQLDSTQNALLLPLFARLVRLGDTGGATRKIAKLTDMDPERAELARFLATEDAGRLLLIGDETVEIAHEALVTQWPWLQAQIQANAEDIRTLSRLGDRTTAWLRDGNRALPTEADRETFADVAQRLPGWLAQNEIACIRAATRRARRTRFVNIAAVALIAGVAIFASWMAYRANVAEQAAVVANAETQAALDQVTAQGLATEAARKTAVRNAADAFTALSQIAARDKDWPKATTLALAAWPRSADDYEGPMEVADILNTSLPALTDPADTRSASHVVTFSQDGSAFLLDTGPNGTLTLRDTRTGDIHPAMGVLGDMDSGAFVGGNQFVAGWRSRPFAILIDLANPDDPQKVDLQNQGALHIDGAPNDTSFYILADQGFIYQFDPDGLRPTTIFGPRIAGVRGSQFTISNDGRHIAFAVDRKLAIWDRQTEDLVQSAITIDNRNTVLRFIEDDSRLLVTLPGTSKTSFVVNVADFNVAQTRTDDETPTDQWYAVFGGFLHRVFDARLVSTQLATEPSQRLNEIFATVADAGNVLGPYGFQLDTGASSIPTEGSALVSRYTAGHVQIWDAATGTLLRSMKSPLTNIIATRFLSETELAVVDVTGETAVIDLKAGADIEWWSPDVTPSRVTIMDDGQVLFLTAPELAAAYQFPSGARLAQTPLPPDATSMTLADDVSALVFSTGDTVVVRRFDGTSDITATPVQPSETVAQTISAVRDSKDPNIVFSRDGRAITVRLFGDWRRGEYTRDAMTVIDTATGEILSIEHVDPPEAGGPTDPMPLLLANDPQVVADTYLNNLPLWNFSSDQVAMTPDKTRIAVRSDGRIAVLDTATGIILRWISDEHGPFIHVAFPAPDTLHGVTRDGRIGTWNLSDIATGTAFQVACNYIRELDMSEALRGYAVTISDPICQEGYAPPLPTFLQESHAVLDSAAR